MQQFKLFSIILLLSFFQKNISAQNVPCASGQNFGTLVITGDTADECNDGAHLTATFTAGTDSILKTTSSYSVVQNTYSPEPWIGSNNAGVSVDDYFSSVITLPFKFCFFGNNYDEIVLGANGIVSFNTSLANTPNTYATSTWGALPYNSPQINNSIMTPYHDMYPSINPNEHITYDVYGTAPCRKFVVSWYDVALFSCLNPYSRQQVVLYETTNEITINIENKSVCNQWNGGLAYEGIQDINALNAYTVPNRNGTVWSAVNDSWSFVPNGTPAVGTISWVEAGSTAVLHVGPTFDYFPGENKVIQAVLGGLADCEKIMTSDTQIITGYFLNAEFKYKCCPLVVGNFVQLTNLSVAPLGATYTYYWGDGTTSNTASPSHTYSGPAPYNIVLVVTFGACVDSYFKTLTPADFNFANLPTAIALGPDSVCSNGFYTLTHASKNNYETTINFGDGVGFVFHDNEFGMVNQNETYYHTYANSGTYTITVHCINEACGGDAIHDTSKVIYIEKVVPEFNFTFNRGCTHDIVLFNNTSTNATNYKWYFGDGDSSTLANPTHSYVTGSIYTATLIATSTTGCELTETAIINTIHPLYVDFFTSKDTICEGAPVTVINNSSGLGPMNYLWNFGDGNSSNLITGFNHIYAAPGLYWITLTATDGGGCIATKTVPITVTEKSHQSFVTNDSLFCDGGMVSINDSIGPGTLSYTWSFGDGTTLANIGNPSHSFNAVGVYTITLTTSYLVCFPQTSTQVVTVVASPAVDLGIDTSACDLSINPVTLQNYAPLAGGTTYNYLWNTGASSATFSAASPAIYWLQITDVNNNCFNADTIIVDDDCSYLIPNAFTPNNDGMNDKFFPAKSKGMVGINMEIYNRWGEKVYTSNNINDAGWDGTYRGKKQNIGTYVYKIKIQFVNGKSETYDGNVSLLR